AVRVAGRVAALQPGLMHPQPAEVVAVRKERRVGNQPAVGCIELGHPGADTVGIELVIPRRVQRIGGIDPPAVGRSGAAGCGSRRTTPPRRTDPVSRGWKGSLTSNCLSSPVPQQDTYSQPSSTDRSMSDTSGGTAPNGFNAGGR